MDFNPLDLLASTALGDNNSVQKGAQTDPQQPKPAGAQEEEEDEPDKIGDDKEENVDGMTYEGVDKNCEKSDKMGSVKSLKKKKAFSKCTTATSADSACAVKKSVEDVHSTLPAVVSTLPAHFQEDKCEQGVVVDSKVQESNTENRPVEKSAGKTFTQENFSSDLHKENNIALEHTEDKPESFENSRNSEETKTDHTVVTESGFGDSCEEVAKQSTDHEQDSSPCETVSEKESCSSAKVVEKVDHTNQERNFAATDEQTGNLLPVEDLNQSQADSKQDRNELKNESCGSCDLSTSNLQPQLGVPVKKEEEETHLGEVCETNLQLNSGIKELDAPVTCSDAEANKVPASLQTACHSLSLVLLDHCYAVDPGRPINQQNADMTDDSADVFECGDESGSVEDIERRPRSLSVDSNYLQYGLPGTPMCNEQDHLPQTDKLSLLSPTPSVDSLSNDSAASENSIAPGSYYSILVQGSQNQSRISHQSARKFSTTENLSSMDEQYSGIEPVKFFNPNSVESNSCTGIAPKCGKFRIGTFASFSSSNLELDRDSHVSKSKDRLKIGIPTESGIRSSLPSPALVSPGSPFQLLQSPGMEWDRSDAGSDMQDDLDSTTTEEKYLSSSHGSDSFGTSAHLPWVHSVHHDHDYCSRELSETVLSGKPVAEVRPLKVGKRKYTRRKDKLGLLDMDDDTKSKIKSKGKYLKRELLKQDSRFSLPSSLDIKQQVKPLSSSDQVTVKPNPVGRPRKRVDKQVESDIDPETGTKMKITGNFKDHYVYYYSKSNHNTRRKLREGVPLPSSDKIILPAPKPGDIVVPHLSDADIEAIKQGGRAALKKNGSGLCGASVLSLPHQDHMADMDSKIVNTILSMESDSLGSPLPAQGDDLSDHMDLYEEHPAPDTVGFMGDSMALTPDQVDLLLSVVKDVEVPSYPLEHGEHRLTTSQAYEFLTTGDTSHSAPTVLDSLASTTVEKDFIESIMPHNDSKTGVVGNLDSVANSDSIKMEPFERSELDDAAMKVSLKDEPKSDQDSDKGLLDSNMPPTSLPMSTFDKTLEFLKDDFRTDLFPEASLPAVQVDGPNSSARLSEQPPVETTDTPWIVTVTIYWNDIPAIIINNQPYVRLVDIHKQILPAKDTGILKKRCQLMNIPVQNCTDMQRYFLVQYGRAYNSKSTLVITKDQAQELIGYYVDPQPRLRTEESGSYLKKSGSCVELSALSDSSSHHPSPFASPRRRGGFRRRATPATSRNPSPVHSPRPSPSQDIGQPQQPPTSVPVSAPTEVTLTSKRLRHKKINFLELLRGEESPSAVSPESPRPDDTLLDAGMIDESTFKEDGRRGRRKRGRSKDTQDGENPMRQNGRGFKKRKQGDESKITSPKQVERPDEVDISVEMANSYERVKVKKRSPGLSASPAAALNRPRASRFGPLKVKLKSLLQFPRLRKPRKQLMGRKPQVADGTDLGGSMPLRVLKITHQDAEGKVAGGGVMSQEAEVHLDLYKQRTSLCVKCWTCDKFLSVPRFLQHQHLSSGSQSLTTVKQLQVLMPMNKENISEEEEHLWNEFVHLQRHLDQSSIITGSLSRRLQQGGLRLLLSEAAPPSRVSLSSDVHSSLGEHVHSFTQLDDVDQSDSGLAPDSVGSCMEQESTPATSVSSPDDGIGTNSDASIADECSSALDTRTVRHKKSEILFQSSSFPPPPLTHTVKEEKKLDIHFGEQKTPTTIHCQGQQNLPLKIKQHRMRKVFPSSNVRTSSRKRKEKQFFSIENYSFSRKSAKLDSAERRDSGMSLDVNQSADKPASVVAQDNGSELMSFT